MLAWVPNVGRTGADSAPSVPSLRYPLPLWLFTALAGWVWLAGWAAEYRYPAFNMACEMTVLTGLLWFAWRTAPATGVRPVAAAVVFLAVVESLLAGWQAGF